MKIGMCCLYKMDENGEEFFYQETKMYWQPILYLDYQLSVHSDSMDNREE